MWKKAIRLVLCSVVALLAVAWFFFWPLLGKVQNMAVGSAEIVVTHLAGSVYRLDAVLGERQAGGAVLASVGEDGVLLVDSTGSAVLAEKILDALRELGGHDVKMIINTHPHPDHVGGNERLATDGATIVGHARTAYWMARPVRPLWFVRSVPPYPSTARPKRLVEGRKSFSFNGETVRLVPLGPAHTDGDLAVYFVDSRVAHVGDLFNGPSRYSTASWVNGGDIGGLERGLATVAAELPSETLVVGGHSAVGSSASVAQLEAYRKVLRRVTIQVEAGLRAGKDDDQLVAETVPLHSEWFTESDSAGSMNTEPAGWVGNITESLRRSGKIGHGAADSD